MGKLINLINQKFGRLTPIKYMDKDKFGNALWFCRCDCGNEKIISGRHLRKGMTKSCGCLKIELLNCWTKKEDDVLKQFYPNRGLKCFELLNRTKESIISRAAKLHLRVNYAKRTGLLKKVIIKKLSENRVLSLCKVHGENEHYYKDGKIQSCLRCNLIKTKKYRKNPINNLACRLRNSIHKNFIRIQNGEHIKIGALRYLDYTKKELYDYLENIKNLQKNKCPYCQTSYDKCVLSIDHVIPLKTANTKQEIINLFDLKNLNLMCKSCNSSKQNRDYKIWTQR